MKKISFIGDIMCEPMLLKASKINKGYNFDGVFEYIRDFLKESDYVVANLETPIAGEQLGFTSSLFEFNAPIEFLDALKDAGINLVTTANNHSLDRGIDGAENTLKNLKKKNISNTGMFLSKSERKEAEYIELSDTKIAIISYTYGTNYFNNKIILSEDNDYLINILRPQDDKYYKPYKFENKNIFQKAGRRFASYFSEEKRYYVLKYLGLTNNWARSDDVYSEKTISPYLYRLKDDIKIAKSKADIVIFCPHMGGQFNENPGKFTEYIVDKSIEYGADAIVASHPHVVQKYNEPNGIPCFFSLGNFTMSPNSDYLLYEDLPQYGIMAHIYIDNNTIVKKSFSIVKMIEKRRKQLQVFNISDLYKISSEKERINLIMDTKKIIQKVLGSCEVQPTIQDEYEINMGNNYD